MSEFGTPEYNSEQLFGEGKVIYKKVESIPTDKINRPDCYKCKHMRPIPGNSHIQCRHPTYDKIYANPMTGLITLLGKRLPPTLATPTDIKVTGNITGIRNGWFNHPFNFDTTWLIDCTGFEAKE